MMLLESFLMGLATGAAGTVTAFAVIGVRRLERKADK